MNRENVTTYVEATATRIMRDLPRFGHTSAFSNLFGSAEQQSDYIYGLLFAGILILTFFLVWTILIPIFKCLGRSQVGCLSGAPMQVPKGSRKPLIIRSTFCLAAITLLIFSVLLVTKGLTQLQDGVFSVYSSVAAANAIAEEAGVFVDKISYVSTETRELRDDAVALLRNESFCPNGNLTNETGIDFNGTIEETIAALNNLSDFSQGSINKTQYALEKASETADNAENTSEEILVDDWQSLVFIIPFTIFFCAFMIAVGLAWSEHSFERVTCLTNWFFLPLFFILVIICYFLSSAIALAASANADFCSGGDELTPAGTIDQIMRVNGLDENDLSYRVMKFYLQLCESPVDPLNFLRRFEGALMEANRTVAALDGTIANATVEQIESICGTGEYLVISRLVNALARKLDVLLTSVQFVLDSLSCQVILPLYTTAFNEGTCQYSVAGVTWAFSSYLVIAAMGMLMITLRTAWHPTEYVDDKLDTVAPMEYVEEYEVEYQPNSPDEAYHQGEEEAYGLEEAQPPSTAVTVAAVTGVAAEAAVTGVVGDKEDRAVVVEEAYGAAMTATTSETIEDGNSFANEEATGETDAFDDSNWLNVQEQGATPHSTE